jgi:hypothetical protein
MEEIKVGSLSHFSEIAEEEYKDIVELTLFTSDLSEEILKNLHKFINLRVFHFAPSEINSISDNFEKFTRLEEILIRYPWGDEDDTENKEEIMWNNLLKIPNLKKVKCRKDSERLLVLFAGKKTIESVDVVGGKIKKLPSSIVNYASLRHLRISGCRLIYLPNELFDLITLEYIDASKNYLSNIPDSVGKLVNLVELNLSENLLTHVSNKLNNLSKLKNLSLSSNKLKKFVKQIGNMQSLVGLNLAHNNIKKLPVDIGNLTNLKKIHIENNNIYGLPYSFRKTSKKCLLCVYKYQPFLKRLPNNFRILNIAIGEHTKITNFPKKFKKLILHFKGDYGPVKETIKNINLPKRMIAKKYCEFLWCFFFENEPEEIENFMYHNMCD